MTLTTIESFSGAGGMTLGLRAAGYKCLLAFDSNKAAIETYQSSIGKESVVMDATEIDGRQLMKAAGVKRGELDLFSGGPPCQGFSLQRRSGYESDQRNDLVGTYFKFVEEIMPRAFLLENVVMLGKLRGKKYTTEGFARLHKRGYQISYGQVNCANYGISQTRKRFMAVGILGKDAFQFPYHSHKQEQWLTVSDAIGDLPDCPHDFTEDPVYANHIRCNVTKKNLMMLSYVPPGGGWRDIPKHLWLPCMSRWNGSSGGWPDVYGRLEWGGRCPTITAGFDSFSRGRYTHPKWDRAITPREAARLQSFPDNVRFYGTRHDVRLQIGNAVPPRLAEVFGKAIACHLKGQKVKRSGQTTVPEFVVYQPAEKQKQIAMFAA